jgi:glycosyltransferase involved in cell wall biosynthesis
MKTSAQAFAFIKMGGFSHANDQVLRELQAQFPELEADIVDVDELRIVRKRDAVRLLFEAAKEYGLSACLSAERFRRHIPRTSYFFYRARELVLRRLKRRRYVFTFQTQSLFDASVPGVPHFIYTDHTHLANLAYPASAASTPLARTWVELERRAYLNARITFTMSANISRSLIEQYGCPPHRVQCVYAGCNVSAQQSNDPDGSRFANKNILFVGVDWERKGGPVLLEAFRSLRRAHTDATLTIVGCSPAINEPGCRVAGRVPLSAVADFYRSASIFCLPTLNEPFGLVFLEAFDHGLPIVATHVGAIPEFVLDGVSGYLVAPNDVGQLADRLTRLLDDPGRCAEFGSRGRQLVRERYSWQATGQRLAAHIRGSTNPTVEPGHEPPHELLPVLARHLAL